MSRWPVSLVEAERYLGSLYGNGGAARGGHDEDRGGRPSPGEREQGDGGEAGLARRPAR